MSIQHENAAQIHMFAFVSAVDPGPVGAFKGWINVATTPYSIWIRDGANTFWSPVGIIDQDIVDISNLSPVEGDILQFKSGQWSKSNATEIKTSLSLENVPNVDATNRANHSGTQTTATISNFLTQVDNRVATRILGSGLTANITYTSNATESDTPLSVMVEAGGMYDIRATLHVNAPTTPGFRTRFFGTATVTSFIAQYTSRLATAGTLVGANRGVSTVTVYTVNPSSGNILIEIQGWVNINLAGTFLLQAAQQTSDATPTVLLRGSTLVLTRTN